jgi:hypothetical protein
MAFNSLFTFGSVAAAGRLTLFRRPVHDEDVLGRSACCVPPGNSIESEARRTPYFWLK